MKLGDFCSFHSGQAIPKTNGEGTIPIFGSTGMMGFTSQALTTDEAVLVARVGAQCGMVRLLPTGGGWVTDNTLICRPDKNVASVRFLYYLLSSINLHAYCIGSAQPLLTGAILKQIDVNVPSLGKQEHIVDTTSTRLKEFVLLFLQADHPPPSI